MKNRWGVLKTFEDYYYEAKEEIEQEIKEVCDLDNKESISFNEHLNLVLYWFGVLDNYIEEKENRS